MSDSGSENHTLSNEHLTIPVEKHNTFIILINHYYRGKYYFVCGGGVDVENSKLCLMDSSEKSW